MPNLGSPSPERQALIVLSDTDAEGKRTYAATEHTAGEEATRTEKVKIHIKPSLQISRLTLRLLAAASLVLVVLFAVIAGVIYGAEKFRISVDNVEPVGLFTTATRSYSIWGLGMGWVSSRIDCVILCICRRGLCAGKGWMRCCGVAIVPYVWVCGLYLIMMQ